METIGIIFHTFFYRPLFNGMMFLYYYIPGRDFGITIIIFTILIKLILYPLGAKAIKSQKSLAKLSPKVKEIKEKYKGDKEKQTKEIMDFYKKENINPFSGCLPLLLQLPIMLALFRVFRTNISSGQNNILYSITPTIDIINTSFLGIVDLSEPNLFLAVVAGITLFFQVKINAPMKKSGKKDDIQNIMQTQMQYFMPFFTILILLSLPSALGLYWIISNLFSIGQYHLIFRKNINR